MTKKDYELIAGVIRLSKPTDRECAKISQENRVDVCEGCRQQRLTIARDLCDRLELDNPLFNRQRFMEACGVEGA